MLRSRVLTALALAAILIATILMCPPPYTAAVLALILLVGAWEWSAFLAVGMAARVLYIALLMTLAVAGFWLTRVPENLLILMQLAVLWWLLALAWIIFLPQHANRGVIALAGAITLLPPYLALVHIDQHWQQGPQWTLFILALAFAADTGGFFAGRNFGRLRLAPMVSPNKTWEGALGGMLLALVLAVLGVLWFHQPAAHLLPLCLAAAAISIVGDLTESLLKRHVNLKDSGKLFPGHGGVLDRVDSVTAATPVMALGLIWLGVGH